MALSPYFCEQSIDNNKGHGVRLLGRTHGALLVRNNTKRKSLNSKGLNEYNKLLFTTSQLFKYDLTILLSINWTPHQQQYTQLPGDSFPPLSSVLHRSHQHYTSNSLPPPTLLLSTLCHQQHSSDSNTLTSNTRFHPTPSLPTLSLPTLVCFQHSHFQRSFSHSTLSAAHNSELLPHSSKALLSQLLKTLTLPLPKALPKWEACHFQKLLPKAQHFHYQ